MSEEQFNIWKQVENKGLEKIGDVKKALMEENRAGFKKASEDYFDFIRNLTKVTEMTTGDLDEYFTTLVLTSEK